MASVELLTANRVSDSMGPILDGIFAAAEAAGDTVRRSFAYGGSSEWLVLAGVGFKAHAEARDAHVREGGKVLHWDHGYFRREKVVDHMRMCINSDHPQQYLDRTPADPSRWDALEIPLREDCDPNGHILLIGMGTKSREYLREHYWEERTLHRLQGQLPGRKIIFRPKGKDRKRLPVPTDRLSPIEDLLRGAALVVCRHSNVAVDATIAGVPFEARDGAARWLQGKSFTPANRLDFLRRLAWWQYRAPEAAQAWAFAKRMA